MPSGSKKKLLLFKTITVLLPFLLLFLLEISLRVFHYGYDLSLFIEYPGNHDFFVLNPDASKRYFNDPAIAPTGNIEPFKKIKDPGTLRIFVLGESTTIGYPYFHNGSFHRWLLYRLIHTWPDRHFEIINLSLTAVNSYTVLGFAKELVKYEPDVVLIYSGHNEYYGTLGVGSTSRIGGSQLLIRSMLWLRELRVTQLIGSGYKRLTGIFHSGRSVSRETMMQRMAGEQNIPFGSSMYNRGIEQFTTNMNAVLDLFNEHHIPVFVSNLVSNEKDFLPFISSDPDNTRASGFKKNFSSGLRSLQHNDDTAALGFFKEADLIYGENALCNYYLGQAAFRLKDYQEAEGYFSRACDLDGLRFRAPSALNKVIARLCASHPNAHLVDTKAAFTTHSVGHIIGAELMLEHVHPNLNGYALMSDVFYETLKKVNILDVSNVKEMSFTQLIAEMPVSRMDSLTGIYRITKLKKSWPFSEGTLPDPSRIDSSLEERLAYGIAFERTRWRQAMGDLYDHYIAVDSLPAAAKVMEAMTLEYPIEPSYYERAANVYGKLKDFESSAFYFRKAFALSPGFEQARILFVLYLDLDKPREALPYINYAIENQSDRRILLVKKNTQEIIRLEKDLAGDSVNVPLLSQIADYYFGMGGKAGTLKYVARILRAEPGNRMALGMRERFRLGE